MTELQCQLNNLLKQLSPERLQVLTDFAAYLDRIGDYRAIYSIDDELVQVFVVEIVHRSEAYEP